MSEHPLGERPVPVLSAPRLAAIVAMVRRAPGFEERAAGPFELFVVRRARELKMFGGFVALVGGGLDKADAEGEANDDDALVFCAARELFEEAGVLAVDFADRVPLGRRDEVRRVLCRRGADAAGFRRFLGEYGLSVDRARFRHAGRWVTPRFVPGRFDAHVFLVEAGKSDEACVWPGELTSGEWTDPAQLVAQWERGHVLLHPPQSHIARTLALANASSVRASSSPASARANTKAALEASPTLLDVARDMATGGSRDDEQVAIRVDFQRGIILFPVVTPTLPPAQHTNCYIAGTGEFIVVDPGSPYPDEQARLHHLLDKLLADGQTPRAIVLTHHHEDHIGGAWAAASHLGVPILGHQRTLDRVPTKGGVITRAIEDGTRIALGGPLPMEWTAVFTPGHARGHICFHDERSGAMLCGDMVSTLSTIIIDPPEGDLGDYLSSLERMKGLSPRTLYPAHGLPTQHAMEKLDEYLFHRRARAEALASALAAGARTLIDLVTEVYADVPPIVHPLAARSALASLLWLARKGRVRAVGKEEEPEARWSIV